MLVILSISLDGKGTFLLEVTAAVFSGELRNVVFGELVERLVEK